MAAITDGDRPLDLLLFDEHDDDEDLTYKAFLEAVLTGSNSPSEAAIEIDNWIVEEAIKRHDKFKDRNPPLQLTPDEEESGKSVWALGPNPHRHVRMVMGSIARICSSFPPAHPSQIILAQLLQELKSLPARKIPTFRSVDDLDPCIFDETEMLWQNETEHDNPLSYAFFDAGEGELAYTYSDVEVPGSEVQFRWRNLQAFIARITVMGIIDCSFSCALDFILPSSFMYPNLETRKIGGPRRIGGDLIAASTWLEGDAERLWVYEQCMKLKEVDSTRKMWSKARWRQWKDQMLFIAGDERFSQDVRELAQGLWYKMVAQETA